MGFLQNTVILLLLVLLSSADASSLKRYQRNFSSFEVADLNDPIYVPRAAQNTSNIQFGALQITPDSTNPDFSKQNLSGRMLLKTGFHRVQSFNTTFVLNITPEPKGAEGGEGVAFTICNSLADLPKNSYGKFLGLYNDSTDGVPSNGIVAVEFDTFQSGDFDPDDNHVGVDVHSIRSVKTFSLKLRNITIKSAQDVFSRITYNGSSRYLQVFVGYAETALEANPVISMVLDLSGNLSRTVYFGFSGSTGHQAELNCVKSWNITVLSYEKKDYSGVVVGVSVGISVAVLVFLGIVFGLWRRRAKQQLSKSIRALDRVLTDSTAGPRKFRLRELRRATHNFDKKWLLGRGGFGAVYKGVLVNKTPVAVKRVAENSNQGEQEFIAEVMIISRLRHRNLVRLLGWCYEDSELLLVYDYMPNGSLDKHIFHEQGGQVLDWNHRYKIICGIASALLYLHEECEQQVIHRDLKASNVMLDSEYNARLGDFGLAKLIQADKNSYTTSAIAGTPGYIAPECFHTGRATVHSDIFSFGAVVLEIACGRRPRMPSMDYLVDWVWAFHKENTILEAADPTLSDFNKDEMTCVLLLGLACSHPNSQSRPSMRTVQQILAKEAPAPSVPWAKPFFLWPPPPDMDLLTTSSDYSSLPSDCTPSSMNISGHSKG